MKVDSGGIVAVELHQLGAARARAEQYVRNAPSQIQSDLRKALRNELGWSDNELPILFV
jgi:hypothetical protein